jgi:hypothetical protein
MCDEYFLSTFYYLENILRANVCCSLTAVNLKVNIVYLPHVGYVVKKNEKGLK